MHVLFRLLHDEFPEGREPITSAWDASHIVNVCWINEWPLFILLFFLWVSQQAEGCAVEGPLIQARWKPPRQEALTSQFSFWRDPRKWTPLSDPAGGNKSGSSCSSDTMEREEGVTAIEVAQWLELQDTSVKQEGRGSSNPWNPDLLEVTSKTSATLLESRGIILQQNLQEYLVLVQVL